MKKKKGKDEECSRERTFINRGNNNKRYRKNASAGAHTHTHRQMPACQDMQHADD
jgi:hypothetical protein